MRQAHGMSNEPGLTTLFEKSEGSILSPRLDHALSSVKCFLSYWQISHASSDSFEKNLAEIGLFAQ
jgi:hypothetical protein